jgi:hypothetical protein
MRHDKTKENILHKKKDMDLLSQYLAESESIHPDWIRFRTSSESQSSRKKDFDFRTRQEFPLHQHIKPQALQPACLLPYEYHNHFVVT